MSSSYLFFAEQGRSQTETVPVQKCIPSDDRGEDAINSELMLFQPSVINEGAEYLQWRECLPINQISEDSSIDLLVKASGSQYLDLHRSVLCVKAKIVKEDGTSQTETVPVQKCIPSDNRGEDDKIQSDTNTF